jgi:AcrR family transcriptional regulator
MKTKIAEAAKLLFSEVGYKKARLTDLALRLNISRGNLTYYFPSKDSIVEYLFEQFRDSITDWIDYNRLPIRGIFARRTYHIIISDTNLLTNAKVCKFYVELIGTPVLDTIMRRTMRANIKLLMDSERISLSLIELDYFTEALVGAYQAMDMLYIQGSYPNLSINDFIWMKQLFRIRSLCIKYVDAIRDEYLFNINFLKELSFSHLTLL